MHIIGPSLWECEVLLSQNLNREIDFPSSKYIENSQNNYNDELTVYEKPKYLDKTMTPQNFIGLDKDNYHNVRNNNILNIIPSFSQGLFFEDDPFSDDFFKDF